MATPQKENGYTPIANELIEAFCRLKLSPYESMLIWYILRKTYGYNKKSDRIPNSQFVSATGMHKAHVSRTKARLIERKIVTKTGNNLNINKNYEEWIKLPKQVTKNNAEKLPNLVTELPKQVTEVTQTGNKSYLQRRTQKTKDKLNTIYQKKGNTLSKNTPGKEASNFFKNTNGQQELVINMLVEQSGVDREFAKQEIKKFVDYWTEPTKSGRQQRWETEKTFEIRRRMTTWFRRIPEFTKKNTNKNSTSISI